MCGFRGIISIGKSRWAITIKSVDPIKSKRNRDMSPSLWPVIFPCFKNIPWAGLIFKSIKREENSF